MAKMRRLESKTALARQRTELRRGARGKVHVGDDTGSARARAAERERVHHMQEQDRERHAAEERARFLADLRHQREQAEERAAEARHGEHLQEPITALFAELLWDGLRLARTFVLLPIRVAATLRHRAPRSAEA